MPDRAAPLAFADHDHAACCADVLASAEALVAAKGLRLTPVRRRTLEILLESHRALGAYDVLSRLATDGFGAQPPVAYRALEFLVENGLAHRIRRLNAFAACMHPGQTHSPAFFICSNCDLVAETPGGEVAQAMGTAAGEVGFCIARLSIEASGLCPACQDAE